MLKKIITNTSESREAFIEAASEAGGGSNANEVVLSADEISALQQGACIALDDGELALAPASYDDADTDPAAKESQEALDSAEFKVALLLNRPWALSKQNG